MKINKSAIVLLLMLATVFCAHAQDSKKDKIKALKVAFFTERLELSSQEAEAFWPVYNTYWDKRTEMHHSQYNEVFKKIGDSNLSEDDSAKLLKKYLTIEAEEEDLDRDFFNKISKTISAKKALLLIKAEDEFKRKLIAEYRQKHDDKKN